MRKEEEIETRKAIDKLGEVLKTFGKTVGEIFDDPKVKDSAKQFAASVVDTAAKVAEGRVKAAEMRGKVRNVGKAAQTLGRSVETHFSDEPANQ